MPIEIVSSRCAVYEQNYGHPFPNGVSLRMAFDSLVGDVKGSIVSIRHIQDGVVKFCEYDDPIDRYQWRKNHDVVAYTNRITVIHFKNGVSLRMAFDSLMGDVKGSIVSICHMRDGVGKYCEYDDPIDRYQWRKLHDVVTYVYEQNYGHPFPNGVSLRMAFDSLVGDVK